MVNKNLGQWYAELSTQFGDKSGFFTGDTYHGYAIDKDEVANTVIVRPVVSWEGGNLEVALGGETNLVSDSVTVNGGAKDIASRNGGGLTATYSMDDFYINGNVAYMDAVDETNTTVGASFGWSQVGFGYLHANNEIENANTGFEYLNGTHKLDTFYAAYKFSDVFGFKNFETYLGAYYSVFNPETGDNTDRLGGRVRFKYFF